MPSPIEPTTGRQRRLYEDTCNIWARDAAAFTDGKERNDESFTLLYTSQKFYLFTKSEIAAPHIPGRMGADNIFTLDEAHFPEGVTIDQGYVIKVTTPGHPLLNTYWRVMGDPQVKTARTRRKPALKAVYVKRLPAAPNGVS